MAKVKIESGIKLSALGQAVCEIENAMRDELKQLNDALDIACESWRDVNAQACKKVIDDHNAVMRSELGRLDGFEKALFLLGELASEYENI